MGAARTRGPGDRVAVAAVRLARIARLLGVRAAVGVAVLAGDVDAVGDRVVRLAPADLLDRRLERERPARRRLGDAPRAARGLRRCFVFGVEPA